RELFKTVRNEGLFTPPSLQGSIELPGHNGGANWGSGAVDPVKGYMYIVAKNIPTLLKIVPPGVPARGNGPQPADPGAAAPEGRGGAQGRGRANGAGRGGDGAARGAGGGDGRGRGAPPPPQIPEGAPRGFVAYASPYDFMFQSNGLSALNPPWSLLTAY